MKTAYIVYETDQNLMNKQVVGVFTAKSKALKEVFTQIENVEGEISTWQVDFIENNMQSEGLETNYIIQEQETNIIFN